MGQLLFSLIFTVSGVPYTLFENLSVYQCSGKLRIEREAIKHVHAKHPNLSMKIECKQQNRLES